MQEAYVSISGVPTHIMTWGKWIEESLDDVKEVIVCVTGNPGLPGFYTEFLGELHENLHCEIPTWVIGHVGHDDPPSTSVRQVPSLYGNEHLFDLNAQIKHKVDFIETYVPKHTKIHLIGHSIGAWMLLELLKNGSVKNRVQKCYCLFPTVERMVDSPNGWIFTNFVVPIFTLFGFFIQLFARLPTSFKLITIYIYFWLFSIPRHFTGTALKYTKPAVLEKVVFLAKDEMKRVASLDTELLRANKGFLKMFYGTTDGWVPVRYYKELKRNIPDIDATLDTDKISHAFVLRSSRKMARILTNWINENRI